MRSFASVILHLLAPLTPSVLILDEPEAFLHPPQARLLGHVIGNERSERAQLFVATHSPDVLEGLVNVAAGHLRVLRIQREGNVNRVDVLDQDHVKEISVDPFMKYSSVLSGVFHERVVVCEGDSDCVFYNSLLALPDVHGDFYPRRAVYSIWWKTQNGEFRESSRCVGSTCRPDRRYGRAQRLRSVP